MMRALVVTETGDAWPSGFIRALIYKDLLAAHGFEVRYGNPRAPGSRACGSSRLPCSAARSPRAGRRRRKRPMLRHRLARGRDPAGRVRVRRHLPPEGRVRAPRRGAARPAGQAARLRSQRRGSAPPLGLVRPGTDPGDPADRRRGHLRQPHLARFRPPAEPQRLPRARSAPGGALRRPPGGRGIPRGEGGPGLGSAARGPPTTSSPPGRRSSACSPAIPASSSGSLGTGHDPARLPPFEAVRVTTLPFYSQEEMIREILRMDIGLFPLFDVEDSRARGILKGRPGVHERRGGRGLLRRRPVRGADPAGRERNGCSPGPPASGRSAWRR